MVNREVLVGEFSRKRPEQDGSTGGARRRRGFQNCATSRLESPTANEERRRYYGR